MEAGSTPYASSSASAESPATSGSSRRIAVAFLVAVLALYLVFGFAVYKIATGPVAELLAWLGL
jgi:hypothetical protein